MTAARLTAIEQRARVLGLAMEKVNLGPGQQGWRFDSILCRDMSLQFCTSVTDLEEQLDLFASLEKLARDQFLLGVGIASGDRA